MLSVGLQLIDVHTQGVSVSGRSKLKHCCTHAGAIQQPHASTTGSVERKELTNVNLCRGTVQQPARSSWPSDDRVVRRNVLNLLKTNFYYRKFSIDQI